MRPSRIPFRHPGARRRITTPTGGAPRSAAAHPSREGWQTYTSGLMNIEKSLAEIGDRLNKARNDLRIVEEQLLFQMDVVEETKTRALVAETPLADREYRMARDDHDRLVKQRDEVQRDILDLQKEQDRLLDRMLDSGSKV